MNVKITTWKVSTIYKLRDKINEQPPYQRGEVWSPRKKSMLIDSMLRGFDIPKIYLRRLLANAHDYEVADGQQRITAIFKFIENKIPLLSNEEKGLNLNKIDDKITGGLRYDNLDAELKNRFDNYEITIAIIENSTNQEIRTLFGRLQEGDPLIPSEKRNAIISYIGQHIDNFAINHSFFSNSRIPSGRFKRQDYMSHALALILYNNKESLKADLLLKMYLDKSLILSQSMQKKIADILFKLQEIDRSSTTHIYKKYHFIDMFYYLFQNYTNLKKMDSQLIASKFDVFEELRLSNYSNPELLIENKKPTNSEKDLYDYIIAFRYNGAAAESIEVRSRVLKNLF